MTRNLLRWVARSPGRACVYLLARTVTIGGALYSVTEPGADWFDGRRRAAQDPRDRSKEAL